MVVDEATRTRSRPKQTWSEILKNNMPNRERIHAVDPKIWLLAARVVLNKLSYILKSYKMTLIFLPFLTN